MRKIEIPDPLGAYELQLKNHFSDRLTLAYEVQHSIRRYTTHLQVR